MKNLITLAAFVLVTSAFAEPRLEQKNLPASVKEAVKTNYEIGRHQWDAGGVSDMLTFNIEEKGTLKNLLIELMRETGPKSDRCENRAINLFKYCKNLESEASESFDACADELLKNNLHVNFNVLADITSKTNSTDDLADKMNASVETIQSYLQARVGDTTQAIVVEEQGLNVEITTIVLISKSKKSLVVVKKDHGA